MAKPKLIEGDVNGLGKLATACPKIKILMAKKNGMFWVLCQFMVDSGAGVISYIILTKIAA